MSNTRNIGRNGECGAFAVAVFTALVSSSAGASARLFALPASRQLVAKSGIAVGTAALDVYAKSLRT